MRKLLLATVLALSVAGFAQSTNAQGSAQGGAQGSSGQVTIKDTAEYNAYMSAQAQQDPNQKASALESFIQQYPNSVVKEAAYNELLAAYQAAGNAQKLQDAANRVHQLYPNNYRAIAILVFLKRNSAQPDIAGAAQLAQQGLQAIQTKPADVNDADWQKTQQGLTAIFQGAIGQNAVAQKDYPTAQKSLQEAVNSEPNNLANVFPLAQAYLIPSISTKTVPGQSPITSAENAKNGLWYAARSVALAKQQSPQGVNQINQFGLYYFKKYHGSEEGWDQLVQSAASSPMPAAGALDAITVAPPPMGPKEYADKLIASAPGGDPCQMAYDDWLFVLGSGNDAAAQKVWACIQGKLLPVKGKVVQGTADEVQVATTQDDQQENPPKADVTVKMATPLKAAPAAGAEVNLIGKADSYTPSPLMITLTEGKDQNAKAAPPKRTTKAPAKRPITRKKK